MIYFGNSHFSVKPRVAGLVLAVNFKYLNNRKKMTSDRFECIGSIKILTRLYCTA